MAAVARALETSNVTSIKSLAESPALSSVPSAYAFNINPNDEADPNDPEFAIPIVDMSLLTSGSPDQRTQIVHDLVKICEEWGFFIAINHRVPESLMKGMIEAYHGFFSLPDEEKEEFKSGNDVLEMFKYGTSYNLALDKVLLWRDFFKVRTHPEFHSHYKPASFRRKQDWGTKKKSNSVIRVIAVEYRYAVVVSVLPLFLLYGGSCFCYCCVAKLVPGKDARELPNILKDLQGVCPSTKAPKSKEKPKVHKSSAAGIKCR
ncbi:hypothetical protein ABKV19_012913 [Rosa sericea]